MQNWHAWKKRRNQVQSGTPAPAHHKKGTVVKVDVPDDGHDESKKGKKGKQAEK